ncbi:YggS family pyridoxal phosphate-dependent enzyme [Gimibacter soli]|uniref:Pyridoxal phosphate homeostasis protein n=1 Tax=Gimibacter soli TaxID=3024400 RepID=A0AAE9XU95_9PROT|nr:YggS family pyridoxal phosphate-dependent enzyme [Gimibacter soli]WCL54620.1 YggS family pyridoxal phosphate-dependent enzyme [Gimibacter soli]
MSTSVADNLAQVSKDISRMCRHAGAPDVQPRLIAVSKMQPEDRVVEALEAGHRVFGENRVQEAEGRWLPLKERFPDVELHLIGSLQSNKASDAVALFDEIHSLDRIKLADALKKEMDAQGRQLPVYIQVNTGREDQKGGVSLEELPGLLAHAREIGLNVVGLMVIPPVDDDPTLHFALLKKLAARHGLARLSMGMSSDFALAAAMGATDVRVGTAIFGNRA